MGHFQTPMAGTYCMTKHAVEALTGCSRAELHRWGVSVSVLNPGFVRTGIAEKSFEHADAVVAQLKAEHSAASQVRAEPLPVPSVSLCTD